MRRKNLIVGKKVKNNNLFLKDSKIINFYTKFKLILSKDIKKKILPWLSLEDQIAYALRISVKFIHWNLVIKYMY